MWTTPPDAVTNTWNGGSPGPSDEMYENVPAPFPVQATMVSVPFADTVQPAMIVPPTVASVHEDPLVFALNVQTSVKPEPETVHVKLTIGAFVQVATLGPTA